SGRGQRESQVSVLRSQPCCVWQLSQWRGSFRGPRRCRRIVVARDRWSGRGKSRILKGERTPVQYVRRPTLLGAARNTSDVKSSAENNQHSGLAFIFGDEEG